MPRRRKPQRKEEVIYTLVAIRVERYEASVEAGVNHDVYAPEFALNPDPSDPVFTFTVRLSITGESTYPPERAGDTYEISIYGSDAASHGLRATLRDAQARNEQGVPRYRTYRGRQVPVYDVPTGVGHIEKFRGEQRWTVWLFVLPRFVRDALALLGHGRQLYVALHERREGRRRRVQRLSLQTADPAEE